MDFVEELKRHLEQVRDSAGKDVPASVILDPGWVRAEIVRLIERLEREAPSEYIIGEHFKKWIVGDRGIRFAMDLATRLQNSFLRGASRVEVQEYVRVALAKDLGLTEELPSRVRTLELERLSYLSLAAIDWGAPPVSPDALAKYAAEIRAVRSQEQPEPTAIGKVFLSLTGRDAVQWLLSVEMAQSLGPGDPWRLNRETAAHLLLVPREIAPDLWWEEGASAPRLSWQTLGRMAGMGLLRVVDDRETGSSGYELLDLGTRVLKELVTTGGSPFLVLAENLSQNEALSTLDGVLGNTGRVLGQSLSVAATARQARLVAHEIRNALTPAKFALDQMYDEIIGVEAEAAVKKYRSRIDSGVERIYKFVEDLCRTEELAGRPPEPFGLLPAVRDAITSFAGQVEINLRPPPRELLPVLGYRERFVLALVNLLRNAEQARSGQVTINFELATGDRDVLLTVDDDGEGIPEERREVIFQRGVSFRPGGAGEGLALVKEVIEVEMQGKIVCPQKAGGGARFLLRLPLEGRSFQ